MIQPGRVLLAGLLGVGSGAALAQQGAGAAGGINSARAPEGLTLGYMSQDDVKNLADFADSTRMLEPKDLVSPAVATKRDAAMLKALQVPCQLTDARQVGSGKAVSGGKPVDVGLYEVACANGMGYLLTLRDYSSASGISCLAASAALSGGPNSPAKEELTKCGLPANQNLATLAASVMRGVGTSCDAENVRWLGASASPDVLDYTDVTCSDRREWVLRTPVPGSAGNIDVLSCQDAATHGAKCQLSPAGIAASTGATTGSTSQARPDLKWFEEALSKNGVACEVKQARILGRESIKRRYIVEYQCPQQPGGVVAYVPSEGDTVHTFEWIDCATAAMRKLTCQFWPAR